MKPVVATLALIPFLLLSSCGRRTSTVPRASDSGDSESSPSIRKLAWSDPVPYTWGVVPPQNRQPPSDTTIDLNHLESARITSGVDQPIAQPIETSPCDFNHIDTTIDMEKLASVPIRYKTSILGQPQRRTVTPPRIKDGATAAILDFAEEQNLIRGTFAFRAAQDSDGRMWFGTNAGLVMFDGVSSYNYTKAQGLAGSGIWSVMINPDSTIWAGGFMGLDLLDLSKGVVRHVVGPDWMDSAYIFAIHRTRSGKLLLSLGHEAAIFDPERGTIQHFSIREGLRSRACRSAIEDHAGNFWFGTPTGVTILDPRTGHIRYLLQRPADDEAAVFTMHEDRKGRMWIASQLEGIAIIDSARRSISYLTTDHGLCSNDVRSILERPDGTFYLGCVQTEGGLTELDLERHRFQQFRMADGLPSSGVVDVFMDREHQIWLSTSSGGIATINSHIGALSHIGVSQGLSGNLPTALLEDSAGRIWIGSDQGIAILSPHESLVRRITLKQLRTTSRVIAIKQDTRGRIWIALYGDGIEVLYPTTGLVRKYSMEQGLCEKDTRQILEDDKGNIWVASITGLNRFSPDLSQNAYLDRNHGLSHPTIVDLLLDSMGRLWIVHGMGVDVYDTRTQTIRRLILSDDGHQIWGNCIRQDTHGRIWIGTNDEGLFVVDEHLAQIAHLDAPAILGDVTIRSFIEDHGRMYVGTRNGLTIVDCTPDLQFHCMRYARADGLSGVDFQYRAAIRSRGGKLYWCAGNVVTSLAPSNFPDRMSQTSVSGIDIDEHEMHFLTDRWRQSHLQGFDTVWNCAGDSCYFFSTKVRQFPGDSHDGVTWEGVEPPYYVPTTLELPFDRDHVTLHVAGNRTTGLSQTQYRYYVEGLDPHWSRATEASFAEYRNIPVGSYTLYASSRGAAGIWSAPAMLHFTIVPPWYESIWAYALYVSAMVASVLGYGRRRQRMFLRRQKELEAIVEARTIDLELEKERAERSEHFKEQFLANMSHEIRTPMNAVMGMTSLLIEKNPLPEQFPYLESIRRSSESLLVILNDILDLSKIEAGKVQIEEIAFSVRDTLADVESALRSNAAAKGILLTTSIESGVPEAVIGDPTRLQQVLINLTSNAIKFTDHGEVRVECRRVEAHADAVISLEFSVADSGIGMSPDELTRVFESFEQASSDTTRLYGGTGLGLSISKQLVELMGGSISVKSAKGIGSRFTFNILVHPGISSTDTSSSTADRNRWIARLRGVRVLLAEDNELNRIVARDTLQLYVPSITVDECVNGSEALERLRVADYDVILMDVHMPVLDGYEAASRIRTTLTESKRSVPILALTAAVVRAEIDKCKAHGMNGYVAKPFRADDLLSAMYGVLTEPSDTFLRHDQLNRNASIQTSFITDLSQLRSLSEGDENSVGRYVGIYLKSAPALLQSLRDGAATGDANAVRASAHQLKSQLKLVGMLLAADIAEEIERRATDGDPDEVLPTLIEQLGRDCHRSFVELAAYVQAL